MKKLYFSIAILLFCNLAFSQGFHYGVYAGFGGSTIIERNEWAGELEKSIKYGYQLGVALEYEVFSFLSIGTDIGFIQKGDKIKDDFAVSKASLGYLDIPINIAYKLPLKDVKVSIMAGPYTSVAMVGKKTLTVLPEVEPDYEWNFEEHGHDAYIDDGTPVFGEEFHSYKRFDTGLTFGFKIGYKQYRLSANYAMGLTDIKPNETITAKNSSFSFSLAYFLK
ncbi:MAG TPA: porin family protein [Bacteroidales bacterium]|jgi:hypothetical protein|nr:porin family protein [Bacteroidales bacterium]HXK80906.1 porin family protein [Bacteroidales bacterium]